MGRAMRRGVPLSVVVWEGALPLLRIKKNWRCEMLRALFQHIFGPALQSAVIIILILLSKRNT